jgi:membrane-bound serine protease (ClpP class)
VRGQRGDIHHLAADIAVMAPDTSIGAAHPVSLTGGAGEDEPTNGVMREKLENYGSSFIENIASKRHRNVEWAKSAVRQSACTTADDALKLNVIDFIAPNVPDLLKQINGREAAGKTLRTAGARVVEIPMSRGKKFFRCSGGRKSCTSSCWWPCTALSPN